MELYRLELMKIRPAVYVWAVFWIFASLLALGVLFLFLEPGASKEEMLFTEWSGLYALCTAMAAACFGIFSAVIAAKVIVSEYCGKQASVLFTCPVSRRRLLLVKCRTVCCFTMSAAFVSNVSVAGSMYLIARIFGITPRQPKGCFVITVLITSLLTGILSCETGMIAALFGWKKRSVMTTVISGLLIMCFVPNMIAGFPEGIVPGMLAISVLLGLAAGMAYGILVKDTEKMEV